MRVVCACLLISVGVWAHGQTVPKSDDSAQSHLSIADFGLAYPLSNDWIRATELLRRRVESATPTPNFDDLLAAVYVPKSNLSANSPFFSLRAYRQPSTDCKKNLDQPARVKVSSGVSGGLLVKKVVPIYPADARAAYIQGTVVLRAGISEDGDIEDLELVDGPIELAGSAVAAVRQWKYKPYLLLGQPVTVDTQIQVNYPLRP